MSSAQPAANANRLDAYRSCCKRGCTNQQAAHLLHTCLHPVCKTCCSAGAATTEWICPKPDCGLVSRRLLDNPAVMLTPLPADSLCSCKSCHRVHQPNDQRFPVVAYCDKCNLRMCRNRLAAHVYDNCNGQVQHLPDPRPPQLACSLHPNWSVILLCVSCSKPLCSQECFRLGSCPHCRQKKVEKLAGTLSNCLTNMSARSAALRKRSIQLAESRDRLAESQRRLKCSAEQIVSDNRLAFKRATEIARQHVTDVAMQIDALARLRKDRLSGMLSAWAIEQVHWRRLYGLARLATELHSASEPALSVRQRITIGALSTLEVACKSASRRSASVPSAQDCQLGPYLMLRLDFSKSAVPRLLTLGGPCLRLVKPGEDGQEEAQLICANDSRKFGKRHPTVAIRIGSANHVGYQLVGDLARRQQSDKCRAQLRRRDEAVSRRRLRLLPGRLALLLSSASAIVGRQSHKLPSVHVAVRVHIGGGKSKLKFNQQSYYLKLRFCIQPVIMNNTTEVVLPDLENIFFVNNYFFIVLIVLLMFAFRVVYAFYGLHRIFPESAAFIALGVLVSWVMRSFGAEYMALVSGLRLTHYLFFTVLLPPIILDAAYNLFHPVFLNNVPTILTFAILGTLFNFLFIGSMLALLHNANFIPFIKGFKTVDSFFYSSIIVAVDPVAVIQAFEELQADYHLHFLVSGEAMLNDAMTVSLFKAMTNIQGVDPNNMYIVGEVMEAVGNTILSTLGSCILGTALALFCAIITKRTQMTVICEPTIMLSCGLLSYLLAEAINLSGNISDSSKRIFSLLLHMTASLSEMLIFLSMGVELVMLSNSQAWDAGQGLNISLMIFTPFLCLLGRAFTTITLSHVLNWFRTKKLQVMIMNVIMGPLTKFVVTKCSIMLEQSRYSEQSMLTALTDDFAGQVMGSMNFLAGISRLRLLWLEFERLILSPTLLSYPQLRNEVINAYLRVSFTKALELDSQHIFTAKHQEVSRKQQHMQASHFLDRPRKRSRVVFQRHSSGDKFYSQQQQQQQQFSVFALDN
uniref:Na_H_Exchanger domain-containing protein n=1 Tax=Macrostomum lignano TaxID=282301 RepID=A0A1I8JH94_9PLAT